eukprot:gb/GEZN01002072.1/.p1 GENE.gb/GEZN01002072.1/~~gb/GEZN01002072.1/.p1  ORF type:complete len:498 (-),score=48.51 gb/GEZN01002072.1/:1007-2500(-)
MKRGRDDSAPSRPKFATFLALAEQALEVSCASGSTAACASSTGSFGASTAVEPNIENVKAKPDGCLTLKAMSVTEEDGVWIDFSTTDKVLLEDPLQASADVRPSPALDLIKLLGADAEDLYKDNYIAELAKIGFATAVQIRTELGALQHVDSTSVPAYIQAMLGEIMNLVPWSARAATILGVEDISSLNFMSGSNFANTQITLDPVAKELGIDSFGIEWYLEENHPTHDRRIRSGRQFVEYITESKMYENYATAYRRKVLPAVIKRIEDGTPFNHIPKAKHRRSQEELKSAFEAGDADVWKCGKCEPATFHVINLNHKNKVHICRLKQPTASRPHKKQVVVEVSSSLESQPRRLQVNVQAHKQFFAERRELFAFLMIWRRFILGRLPFSRPYIYKTGDTDGHRFWPAQTLAYRIPAYSNKQGGLTDDLSCKLHSTELLSFWFGVFSPFVAQLNTYWETLICPPPKHLCHGLASIISYGLNAGTTSPETRVLVAKNTT